MSPATAAFALMAFNASMGALDTVFVRLVAGEVHPLEIAFFRNLFSLVAILFLLKPAQRNLNANGLWPIHGLRAVLKLVGLVTYFLAITMLPIALVTAVAFTMPLFVTLGSSLLLGERLNAHKAAALLAGLLGMLIILQPPGVEFGMGMVFALSSAMALAAVALLMKVTSAQEDPMRIAWYNLLLTVPLALVLALPVWSWPSPTALALMALQGVGGLLAQVSFARAMKFADASLIISADFLRLPIAAVLGLALFHEPVQIWVLLGGAVIFSGVLFSAYREGRRSGRA